ncbi:hypothetical protein KC353_g57 [Hortaea werneckii]|nr:hypothetical protein KC353_g57 [Hortaea werneckii]
MNATEATLAPGATQNLCKFKLNLTNFELTLLEGMDGKCDCVRGVHASSTQRSSKFGVNLQTLATHDNRFRYCHEHCKHYVSSCSPLPCIAPVGTSRVNIRSCSLDEKFAKVSQTIEQNAVSRSPREPSPREPLLGQHPQCSALKTL